ncbi:hypothetical protein OOT46_26020 [Aquabacterium sp. A7-Y]|uniref:hypothetical protein n=1 Tax=Aquabacterium sp. A7-Y TaxID=1349605 RepID=UPI00223DCAF9|nr:hypothetical protein [Aquabacterium sp. A7-Y]MCW7541272.1 hypothetical protein [Aquabacterium sp. A7-Y]
MVASADVLMALKPGYQEPARDPFGAAPPPAEPAPPEPPPPPPPPPIEPAPPPPPPPPPPPMVRFKVLGHWRGEEGLMLFVAGDNGATLKAKVGDMLPDDFKLLRIDAASAELLHVPSGEKQGLSLAGLPINDGAPATQDRRPQGE